MGRSCAAPLPQELLLLLLLLLLRPSSPPGGRGERSEASAASSAAAALTPGEAGCGAAVNAVGGWGARAGDTGSGVGPAERGRVGSGRSA
jgi:hypothetical protein